MSSQHFLQRVFATEGADVIARFFKPEQHGRDFRCRYELHGLSRFEARGAFGVDGVQALLLAMEMAHADLLAVRQNTKRKITWLGQDHLGLPASQGVE